MISTGFSIFVNMDNDEKWKYLIELAKNDEKIVNLLKEKNIIKEICVPNKLVNFVVK